MYCSTVCQRSNWRQHKLVCKALGTIIKIVQNDTRRVQVQQRDLTDQMIALDLEIAVRAGKLILKECGEDIIKLAPEPELVEYSNTHLQGCRESLQANLCQSNARLFFQQELLIGPERALAAHRKLSDLQVDQHERMTTLDSESKAVCYRTSDRAIHEGGAAVLRLGDAMLAKYKERVDMIDALWPDTARA